ncbi:MAG TPA: methylmalonyl-CoA mutase family protein, partial [Polyangiaceae bacterium]|nr:methylmalonyl-CoA mutase family protein [Polyangiaceae bacterium]
GMVEAVLQGYPQREIARSAYELERTLQTGERVVVGVNRFQNDESARIPTLRVDEQAVSSKLRALGELKAQRSRSEVERTLTRVREAAEGGGNLVPPVIDAARAYASLQEICDVLRGVFGTYTDPGHF